MDERSGSASCSHSTCRPVPLSCYSYSPGDSTISSALFHKWMFCLGIQPKFFVCVAFFLFCSAVKSLQLPIQQLSLSFRVKKWSHKDMSASHQLPFHCSCCSSSLVSTNILLMSTCTASLHFCSLSHALLSLLPIDNLY